MSLPVEHIAPRDSLLARLDARWKLAALMLAATAAAALRSPLLSAMALTLALILAALAKLPGHWFRIRISALLVALLPFALVLLFTVDRGGPRYEFGRFHLSLDGLMAAAALIDRTIAIVTLALVLLGSAPLPVTLRAAHCLRVPGLLVMLTMLSYRYIFLVLDEFGRLRIALRVRGFRNRTNRHSLRTIGQVTGTLLVRGSERAERVSQAMRCRGFDGQFRAVDEFTTSWRDIALFAAIVGAFGCLVLCEYD